ncbi:MAG: CPBP family intramembrane metalloprotease [Lentisphaeria bacterium]|nr:CPBP family intramembrane metalloprotease [Lentisphaeria bacterium]NQZ69558.1 CPBP family intramembrane metalloprotease [Lentisphaeria bacterium]
MRDYFKSSRSGTYGFLAAIPLVLIYEFVMFSSNSQIQVSSGAWIKTFLGNINIIGNLALFLALITMGVIIYTNERKEEYDLKLSYFGGMIAESIILAPIFAVTVGWITYELLNPQELVGLSAATQELGTSRFVLFGLSCGAGVYEEFLFRVLLFGSLLLVMTRFVGSKWISFIIAAIVSSLIFSWIHYLGPMGDTFQWTSFIFRAIAGLAFTILYKLRGFGIAAWTHAIYDIMVLVRTS